MSLISNASRGARVGTRAIKAIRIIRVFRLIRIFKLYKHSQGPVRKHPLDYSLFERQSRVNLESKEVNEDKQAFISSQE